MIGRFEELVTVFGGGGFVGRYVVEILLRSGVRVRGASRKPRPDNFIQPHAPVGQVGLV
jgi:NADH dehydrogenase